MSAGELSDHFAVSKPTMSAHFAVLQEAGLIEGEKSGRTITYRLVMSVLEEALLGFAHSFGWGQDRRKRLPSIAARCPSGPSQEKPDMALTWIASRAGSALPLIAIVLALANWNARPDRAWAWSVAIVIFVVMVIVRHFSQRAIRLSSGDAPSARSFASVAAAVVFGALMMVIPLAVTLAQAYGVVNDPDSGQRASPWSSSVRTWPPPATPCPGCCRRCRRCRRTLPRSRHSTGSPVGRGCCRSRLRDGVAGAADRRGAARDDGAGSSRRHRHARAAASPSQASADAAGLSRSPAW